MGNIASLGSRILVWAVVAALAAVPAWSAPKERTAVAAAVVGQVELSKPSSDKWKKVKTGAKITHRDQVRTLAGAQLDVRLPDGSTLSVAENSVVDFKELLEENGNTKSNVRVEKGTVFFSIKKLTTAQSEFKFETQTATAAIRGTTGFVQSASDRKNGGSIGDSSAGAPRETTTEVADPSRPGELDVKHASLDSVAIRQAGADRSGKVNPADSGKVDLTDITVEDANALLKADEAVTEDKIAAAEGKAAEAAETAGSRPAAPETTLVRDAFFLSDGFMAFTTQNGKSTTIAANHLVDSRSDTVLAFQVASGVDVRDLAKKTLANRLPRLQGIPLTGVVAVASPAAGSVVERRFRVSGRCMVPDSAVSSLTVGGKKIEVSGGEWSAEVEVPANVAGPEFKVPVAATVQGQTFSFRWPLKLKQVQPAHESGDLLEIQSSSPLVPSEGMLTVSGVAHCPVSGVSLLFGPSKAAAMLRFAADTSGGKRCRDASFSARLPVSDAHRNWTVGQAVVQMTAGEKVVAAKRLDVVVDRHDKKVNTIAPSLLLSRSTDGSKIRAAVSDNRNDTVEVSLFSDGAEVSRTELAGNGRATFNALAGVHDYDVVATDLAGNRTEARLKAVEWWPLTNITLTLDAPVRSAKNRVPPLPPEMESNLVDMVTLRILGLPDDDVRAVKRITVTSSAGEVRTLTESEIYGVLMDIAVQVRSKGATTVTVKVEPKNGHPAERSVEVVRGR